MALQRVTAGAVPALVEQLGQQGLRPVLLDVREPVELTLARLEIPGTEFIAMPMRAVAARHLELDRQRPLFTLCHHGARSLQVALYLAQLGYPAVYNIEGGIEAWACDVDPSIARY